MGDQSVLESRQRSGCSRPGRTAASLAGRKLARIDCLEQLLLAFHDIVDRDDIHQAAQRLELVQQWIRDEAERAAADPIFGDLLSA